MVEEFVNFVGLLIQAVPGYQLKSVKVQVASLLSLAETHLKIKVLSWRPPGFLRGSQGLAVSC